MFELPRRLFGEPCTTVLVLLLLLPAAWLPQRHVDRRTHVVRAAKDLHFNKNMEALKKMQAGADKLATVVGVTLGPKVRYAAQHAQCQQQGMQPQPNYNSFTRSN
jgi:hypothetical protein